MKKCTIIHHQGYGDLITNNALCNHYADQYDEVIIFVLDENRKKVIDYMYSHRENIKCEVPKLHHNFNNIDSCLICMTYGGVSCCPRCPNMRCCFIDYSDYQDYDNIKAGCFDDFNRWSNFYDEQYKNDLSFSHAFYLYNGLTMEDRISKFDVYRNYDLEKSIYESIPHKNYIVVHEDRERRLGIRTNQLNQNIYNLNGSSENMIDQITVIENAEEIHFIDSNYSVLIYFLSFKNDKISKIPKYLHSYATDLSRDLGIYNNPTPENWFIIK
jgi:hypothetical protein